MKAMYLAFAATALISVVAFYGLKAIDYSSSETSAGSAVRLSDSE